MSSTEGWLIGRDSGFGIGDVFPLNRIGSVDVAGVAPFGLQRGEVLGGRLAVAAVVRGHHVQQRRVHVLAHGDGAADVEVRTALQPVVDLGATLAQSVLDVDLAWLVTGEGQVEAMQLLALQGLLPLDLVKESGVEVPGAEEQPVAAAGAGLGALLDEAAEWGDAGAGA